VQGATRRTIDIVTAGLALVLLSPVLAVLALAVRMRMGSPVLFRQTRTGFRGELFALFKFRTMTVATRPDGEPLPDSSRLTRLGRFLRRTSLDELPQLWNVFRGDMSLVGPRPLLPEYLPLYSDAQARRHEVKPGITGWAQVQGRNAITWDEKFRLDVWYVDQRSLWLDLRIVFLTVKKVLLGDGVNQSSDSTMEPFRGTPGIAGAEERVVRPAHPLPQEVDDEEEVDYAV
jgi:sugar transferase EpsL